MESTRSRGVKRGTEFQGKKKSPQFSAFLLTSGMPNLMMRSSLNAFLFPSRRFVDLCV